MLACRPPAEADETWRAELFGAAATFIVRKNGHSLSGAPLLFRRRMAFAADGLVQERTAHVKGSVQRRKVYVLTEDGRRKALEIRDRVRSAIVRVRDASGIRDVTVAEALLEARGSKSILDVLRESLETGSVDLRS